MTGHPQSTSHPTAAFGQTGPVILAFRPGKDSCPRGKEARGQRKPLHSPDHGWLPSVCAKLERSLHPTWLLLFTINSQIRSPLPFHVQKPSLCQCHSLSPALSEDTIRAVWGRNLLCLDTVIIAAERVKREPGPVRPSESPLLSLRRRGEVDLAHQAGPWACVLLPAARCEPGGFQDA